MGVSLKPTQIDATASRHLLPLPAESRKAAEKNRKTEKPKNRKTGKPKKTKKRKNKKNRIQFLTISKDIIIKYY